MIVGLDGLVGLEGSSGDECAELSFIDDKRVLLSSSLLEENPRRSFGSAFWVAGDEWTCTFGRFDGKASLSLDKVEVP